MRTSRRCQGSGISRSDSDQAGPGATGADELLGVVNNPVSINHYLVAAGELTDGAKPLGDAGPLTWSRSAVLEQPRAPATGAR